MRNTRRDEVVRSRKNADVDDEDTGLTPRVLLVDPRGTVIELLRDHLPADTQISSADSVQRAMPRIDNEPFDLVVCEIETKGMEQLLAGAARVAVLDGARVVAVNGMRTPGTTTQADLRNVLAHALSPS
jgi:DNA-binding NtrC family response regulator